MPRSHVYVLMIGAVVFTLCVALGSIGGCSGGRPAGKDIDEWEWPDLHDYLASKGLNATRHAADGMVHFFWRENGREHTFVAVKMTAKEARARATDVVHLRQGPVATSIGRFFIEAPETLPESIRRIAF